MAAGRKPDYNVSVYDKVNLRKGIIGAAWDNDNGAITIHLNPGCCLLYSPDLVVALYRVDSKPTKKVVRPILEDEEDLPY